MKHILSTLAFYSQYQGLAGFNAKCASTRRAVQSLEKRGFLKVNWETNQAESTGITFPSQNK